MIDQHLVQAEENVALGLKHIARQTEIVAELKRMGFVVAAGEATQLLKTFEEMQVEHEAHRDRHLRELQEAK